MKRYAVTMPIAGHIVVEVEAASEEEAIKDVMEGKVEYNVEPTWECLEEFNKGNVCYCPQPWKISAEEIEEDKT